MRQKGILKHLNARAAKALVFGALCRIPLLRRWLNYYEDAASFEDVARTGSLRRLVIRPVRDYAIKFGEAELRDIMKCSAAEAELLELKYKMARLENVTILGSAGVTVDAGTGKALYLDRSVRKIPRNWVIARPLRNVPADPGVTYINLLGVRKGHRHFAHFFWDTMVPLMVYLRNWHDPAERVVCLVREDLSAIQRDAYRFIEGDWPGVTFRTLHANEKMLCARSIYIAYQNPNHGKDNAMAREALTDLRDLFLRHYGIAAPGGGTARRVYISRNDAAIRRVKNEPEIVELLKPYGFEVHQPGRMSFRDQAALFHSADVIVAPHGAALANLMFCRPGTRVLEVFPDNFRDEGFLKLSKAMKLEYSHLIVGMGDYFQNFAIDPMKLVDLLNEMEIGDAAKPIHIHNQS